MVQILNGIYVLHLSIIHFTHFTRFTRFTRGEP